MATAALSEPRVLAHAKRRLFPDPAEENAYAVVDTQFTKPSWRSDRELPAHVRDELAPFNHVRIGTGYPDLVGVRHLEDEFLEYPRPGDAPPLFVVEAKGYSSDAAIDVDRGIVQAYDRLLEANAAFVAAPLDAIATASRSLARELNVGLLGVEADGAVEPVEIPRIVGNRSGGEGSAIRFQATVQGVADQSFSLNHPKNYLAYPLALYEAGDTSELVAEYVVGAVEEARKGAVFLGLIEEHPGRTVLTPLGEEIVRFAVGQYGSVRAALEQVATWKRSRERFVDLEPIWGQVARRVLWAYPATPILVEQLQRLHAEGVERPNLVDLVMATHRTHPSFAVELFIRGTDEVRSTVLTPDGTMDEDPLRDGSVYHAPTVFQLKAMLYHAGILTDRGAEPHRLEPLEDRWVLCEPV